MVLFSILKNVTNSVSKREEFNKDFVTFVPKPSWRGIEKNLRYMAEAGHGVQSEGERIIADRLYECGIDYVYDSLIEIDGEWIRPDFILPGLNNLIIEYKGMDDFEYNEKFDRKLAILAAAGMRVMVLRPKDLERVKEIII